MSKGQSWMLVPTEGKNHDVVPVAGVGVVRAAGPRAGPVHSDPGASGQDSDEPARGEFMRRQAVDDTSANATMVDGPLTATLLFRFNAAGLIGAFRAEARGHGLGQVMRMFPWEGRWPVLGAPSS